MAFCLQDFVFFNRAQLANYAVCWHHQHIWVGIDWANIVTQWAHEEFIEGAIPGSIRLLCFLHVDFVVFHEQVDNQFGQPASSFACTPACQASQP